MKHKRKSKVAPLPSTSVAGWPLAEWAPQARIGKSTFHTIPEHLRPRCFKNGRRVIIIESASAWHERIAKLGGLPSRTSAAA